ncbi:right-handed parallel beta-helix repeat-containing protein [Paractinoplanes globisporus]|uniref:Right handed beta helix domain-containing protein n=1 Tax=Paractinoplanes globisporus TaxID=113565 RepID=A0ABW6WG99_9ACTN|nr:right-handed parallel beta-helix repeat-containing protein [Actinoplanes globisporus]
MSRDNARKAVRFAAAAAVLSLTALLPAAPAAAAGTQIIYMNASGSDSAAGNSPAAAVKTLERVEQLVAAGPPDQDVEVRIHAGTYVAQQTIWQTYRLGHTISFMPDDYEIGGGADSIAARPVFQNARASGSNRYIAGYWFYACAGGALNAGGTSGLRFYYLQAQYYSSGGISLDGSAGSCGGGYNPSSGPGQPSARGLDGNTVFGMVLTSLGNAYTGGLCDDADWPRCGYGGIVLTESSGNRIANNHFVNLRNSENSYIHATYITHKSSRNTFTGNNVTGVSSDPVKLRDGSDFNTFDANVFGANGFPRSSTPPSAHYLEEVNVDAGECSSYHNRFTNNDLGTYLIGSSANLPTWYLYPAGATWAGAPGCPALPAGETRLTTANNTY